MTDIVNADVTETEVSAEAEKGNEMTIELDLNTQVENTAKIAVNKLQALHDRREAARKALESTEAEVSQESEGLFRLVEMAEVTLGVSLISDTLRSLRQSKPQLTRQINDNSLRESLISVFEDWGNREFTITNARDAVKAAGYQFGGKPQSNYQRVYSEIKKLLDKGAIVKVDGDKRGVYSFVGLPADDESVLTGTVETVTLVGENETAD